MVITRSVRIVRGTYRLAGNESLDSALITIRGENITVDFDSASLQGIAPDADPDLARGVAIHVDGGRNIRLRNARIRGYRFAIVARGTRNLNILDSDLSFNWKPRLFSLVEHESLVDWLSFHKNEKREWMRFGAAIYLDSVRGGEIRGVRAEQGMNGLLMSNTEFVRVWNSVLSFNSGLGIGLYRSSNNVIAHNHIEFNVRGYSHGRYRRGQDSAGILVYEQSGRNLVAYNSATHGGDGFFLWAGQSTMDTGAGGSNDNIVYGNDFSYAPTNGIEATFSRNLFMANRVAGSDHGVWGGYSFESRFIANVFERNRIGMAIEHGQANTIAANAFEGDSTAISLWANKIEPSDWGYPKFRDTRSRDTRIAQNFFQGHRVALRARATQSLILSQNRVTAVDTALVLDDSTRIHALIDSLPMTTDSTKPAIPAEYLKFVPEKLAGGLEPAASRVARMDRSAIVVDEWGPFDWQYPKLWPVDSTRALPLRLRAIGPRGTWRVASMRGVNALSARAGRIGDTISVIPAADSAGDWELVLQFTGAATRTARGERKTAGTPVRFGYGRFEPRVEWRTRIYDTSADSAKEPDMVRVLGRAPLTDTLLPRLDYQWFRPTVTKIPLTKWALEASARVELPAAGEYTLRTISDDGIRVWVDGVLAIDNWASHESAVNNVPIAAGAHDIRVQYYQREGWMELRLDIVRGVQRSSGSPGPH